MNTLPNDILSHITTFLSLPDVGNLSFVNKNCNNLFCHDLYHECLNEIEDNWNKLAAKAECLARDKDPKYRTPYYWEVTLEEVFPFSINNKCQHYIKVIYTHNPRDVDILS